MRIQNRRFLLFSLGLLALVLSACTDSDSGAEITIESEQPGDGPVAREGERVAVQYRGWLYDPSQPDNKGQLFDSSYERGRPFSFVVGAGQVIEGWDRGVAGMRQGGTRTLIIPPELAYGSSGAGDAIPPNATLVFEIKLIDVRG